MLIWLLQHQLNAPFTVRYVRVSDKYCSLALYFHRITRTFNVPRLNNILTLVGEAVQQQEGIIDAIHLHCMDVQAIDGPCLMLKSGSKDAANCTGTQTSSPPYPNLPSLIPSHHISRVLPSSYHPVCSSTHLLTYDSLHTSP